MSSPSPVAAASTITPHLSTQPTSDNAPDPSSAPSPNPPSAPAPNPHDKPCALCATPRSVLVRCQIDDTQKWYFVCPGKCWRSVSGGVEDARGLEGRSPFYRYGGMWKNKHVDGGKMSAKKPRKVKERQRERQERGMGKGYGSSSEAPGSGEE